VMRKPLRQEKRHQAVELGNVRSEFSFKFIGKKERKP